MGQRPGRSILFGVTAPITAQAFLTGQLAHLAHKGWEVHLLCGEPGLEKFARVEGVHALHVVPTTREPSLRDSITLLGLWRTFHAVRPDVSVLGTPKIGVLGNMAAWLARVPRRVYLVHGYRAEGLTGHRRRLMRMLDRLACAAATDVVAVSPSLATRIVDDHVVSRGKVKVLGPGSANGVDLDRFHPPTIEEKDALRRTFDLPDDAAVVASVGRLTRDKGLPELPTLWEDLSAEHPHVWLLLAGGREPVDDADRSALAALEGLPRVRMLGHCDAVERVYRAADVLLLLSRREGLGMVVLESAACGVPAVAYGVTGVVDAVVAHETGFLLDEGDREGIRHALSRLLASPAMAHHMGAAGRDRVAANFDRARVWRRWEEYLEDAVRRSGNTMGDSP